MSNCILCQEPNQERQLFSEILCIKKKKSTLCLDCQQQFHFISGSTCQFCCKKTEKKACSDCDYWAKQGKAPDHLALFEYKHKIIDYFSLYKFHGDYALRKVFAKEVKLALSAYKDFTIVPIPISEERLEERGFNQVTGILDAAGIAYQEILGKHHSQKQSEKNREERLKSDQHFYIKGDNKVPEKIILVDDIYTTGATIQLATGLLMKNGAKTIKSFSIAR